MNSRVSQNCGRHKTVDIEIELLFLFFESATLSEIGALTHKSIHRQILRKKFFYPTFYGFTVFCKDEKISNKI